MININKQIKYQEQNQIDIRQQCILISQNHDIQFQFDNVPTALQNQNLSNQIYYPQSKFTDKEFIRYISTIQHKKYQDTIETNHQINVKSAFVKNQSTGIFGIRKTQQLWFTIQSKLYSNQKPYLVERSINDFKWLQKTFKRLYPGYIIPFLQINIKQKYTQHHIQIIKNNINDFIKEISNKDILFNSKLMIIFLKQQDKSNFDLFKAQMNATNVIKLVKNIQCDFGQIQIHYTKKNIQTNHKIQSYANKVKNILYQINSNLQNIEKSYNILLQNFLNFQLNLKQLQLCEKQISDQIFELQKIHSKQMLESLSKMIKAWYDNLNQQNQILKSHLGQIFKSRLTQNQSLLAFIENKNNIQNQYIKYRKVNTKKQNNKLKSKSIQQHKNTSLIDQIIIEEQMRNWLGYINTRCQTQFIKLKQQTFKKQLKCCQQMSRKLIEQSNNRSQQTKKFQIQLVFQEQMSEIYV